MSIYGKFFLSGPSHILEHGNGVLLLHRIGNDNAAHVVPLRVRVAVLHFPQSRAVSFTQHSGVFLNMDVMYKVGTVGVAGDGKKKGGAQNIAQLKPGQIIAVPETGHFNNVRVKRVEMLKFLSKDGMGNTDVFNLVAAVGDAETIIVLLLEIIVEIGVNALDG